MQYMRRYGTYLCMKAGFLDKLMGRLKKESRIK